jgi:Dna[CI] antecedent, DciA
MFSGPIGFHVVTLRHKVFFGKRIFWTALAERGGDSAFVRRPRQFKRGVAFHLPPQFKPKIICVHLCPSVVNSWWMPPPRKIPARQRVLAQWRGVDLAPLEAAQVVRARRVGDVLPRVTRDLHMDQRRAEAEIVKVWNSLIDPNIVAHAQPAGVRNGTLFVNVDSNVWLAEIVRYRRKEILDRLQYGFGKNLIRRISFRVG